jgi:hypothetical protein
LGPRKAHSTPITAAAVPGQARPEAQGAAQWGSSKGRPLRREAARRGSSKGQLGGAARRDSSKGQLEGAARRAARRGSSKGRLEGAARRGRSKGRLEGAARRGGSKGQLEEAARRGGSKGQLEEAARAPRGPTLATWLRRRRRPADVRDGASQLITSACRQLAGIRRRQQLLRAQRTVPRPAIANAVSLLRSRRGQVGVITEAQA